MLVHLVSNKSTSTLVSGVSISTKVQIKGFVASPRTELVTVQHLRQKQLG